ncbi:S1 RNA-binding domain-containing protein [Alkalihalobacillus sp. TS-13]|uniref:CvfB family protein n=1 Tax=Alkalihalobacillus sp. TS-13 TaxID=2842455 RepID=UPI0021AB017F|nr:S1-like domain-containing RNA-binding protein [Alkalihalobacillus sp. TS-13]
MNSLEAGNIVNLIVDRKTELGFVLTNAKREEVFLHRSETENDLENDERVKVFLYHDHKGRLAATTTMPFIDMNSIAWLEVVGVKHSLGIFMNIGIKKDVLLSKDDLPTERSLWPQEGDKLYCGLRTDKKGRLFADLATNEEIETRSQTAPDTLRNQYLTGHVYRFNEQGAMIFTDDRYIAFLHQDEADTKLRLGQRLQVRVTFVREDGRLNGSLKAPKEIAYEEDSQRLIDYLEENGGFMPFHDKSAPEDIKQAFGLSKAAFKRAMGKLLKDGKVKQSTEGTELIQK